MTTTMATLTGRIVLRGTLREEDRGEAAVHAHESVEKKLSRTSQGLTLELPFNLRAEGIRADSHRSHTLTQALRTKSKAPPFRVRRTAHPKFNYNARATRSNLKVIRELKWRNSCP
jgi:hypothetical protein